MKAWLKTGFRAKQSGLSHLELLEIFSLQIEILSSCHAWITAAFEKKIKNGLSLCQQGSVIYTIYVLYPLSFS